jgi:hypothetical protein
MAARKIRRLVIDSMEKITMEAARIKNMILGPVILSRF